MLFITFVLKNLLRRRVRSMLTVLGAAVAIGALVALVSISNGFEQSYADMFEARGADLLVSKANQAVVWAASIDEGIGPRLQQVPGVVSVSPMLIDLVSFEKPPITGVPVMGWTPETEAFAHLQLKAGRQLQADDRNGVMLGVDLAGKLGQGVGGQVEIEGTVFHVVGLFEARNIFEDGSAIVLLRDLQQAARIEHKVTAFQLMLEKGGDDEARLAQVKRDVENLRDDEGRPLGLAAKSIQDHVSQLLQIRLAHAMAWMTSALALIIGTVGILNTMVMAVFERTREIGILRALGWRKGRIVRMILLESVVLSILGAVVGTVGAVVVNRVLTLFPSVSGYVRGDVEALVVAEGLLIAVVVGLLGGAYPAVRAALLLPTEALRHE